MAETFDFTANLKKSLVYMMATGLVGLGLVFFLYPANHFARAWSNLLANTYYFTGIGLFGMFAVCAGQIAYGSWQTLEKRIFLSLSAFTRIGGFLLVLILVLGVFHVHPLYDGVLNVLKAKTAAGKVPDNFTTKVIYFAPAFWIGRVLVYATVWFLFSVALNNFFARTDQTDPKVYKRSKLLCAGFIVFFAVTESAISWDMIMSLDTGWYSTLFGWYNFASYGCAAWAMTILIVIFLKSKGYIQQINENHVHDLGKLLFGFSIFWSYLWFDQFMLQWFANVPEETHFWIKRFDVGYFKATIFISLAINFLFPLLFLIKRGAKRSFRMIGFGAALLIFGHYVDFFNYTFVEPNWNKQVQAEQAEKNMSSWEQGPLVANEAGENKSINEARASGEVTTAKQLGKEGGAGAAGLGEHKQAGVEKLDSKEPEAEADINFAGIGICELMVFTGFLGAFLYLFFLNLAKRPIVPENDPYLKENEKLVVTYS
jgi:hypothetical protein